jgi:hypothetical protein
MTSPMAEGRTEPSLASLTAFETLLLEHIGRLESELAAYRPPRPPPGWLPVKAVADKLRLTDVAVYRAASEGRITATRIGGRVWVAPIEVRPPRKKYKRRA